MPLYLQLLHDAFTTELAAIAPAIFLLLAVGIATAILQAALQIEDATFSLLLKTIAMIGLILFGGARALSGFEFLATLWISHAGILVQKPWF